MDGLFASARLASDGAAVGQPPFRKTQVDTSVTGPSDA